MLFYLMYLVFRNPAKDVFRRLLMASGNRSRDQVGKAKKSSLFS